MPTEVFEEPLDLQIYAVESVPLEADGGEEHRRAYPHTILNPTNEVRDLATRAVVLDNEFLRVTILPEIGGRIYSIFDKRIGREILPRQPALKAEPTEGGRGIYLPDGIQFAVGVDPSALSMAHLPYQVQEGAISGLWLASSSEPVGFHVFIGLPGDRAQILIEIRAYNRTLCWQRADVGLAVPTQEQFDLAHRAGSLTIYWPGADAGLAIESDILYPSSPAEVHRFLPLGDYFAPGQLDTWTVRMAPFGGIGKPQYASVEGAIAIGGAVRVQSTSHREGHKLFLLTDDGQTFEAFADIDPNQPLIVDLSSLPGKAQAVVLATPNREEVLKWGRDDWDEPLTEQAPVSELPKSARHDLYLEALEDLQNGRDPTPKLRRANFDPSLKAPCHKLEGLYLLAQKHYAEAAEAFEDALAHNAEDHLTWWYKALSHRLAGQIDDERQDLLNAHYLAPLEPALRVESFLQMDQSMGKEPSTILAPLADHPEQFVEVACLLLDAKLYSEAARLIDEALRHVDLPMLRYLLGYSYLAATRMEVEAAEQVRKASEKPIGPPYPWRPAEVTAIQKLIEKFPEDKTLASWLELVRKLHLDAGARS